MLQLEDIKRIKCFKYPKKTYLYHIYVKNNDYFRLKYNNTEDFDFYLWVCFGLNNSVNVLTLYTRHVELDPCKEEIYAIIRKLQTKNRPNKGYTLKITKKHYAK